jgi:hypothetical protein
MPEFSRGPPPLNNSQVSPHPSVHEAARVLNIIIEISAASAEIIRKYERGNSCIPTATLDRVSALSDTLSEEVIMLPVSAIPPLHKPLTIYKHILIDILHILSSSGPVEVSDYTIDRPLDEFLLQFQVALDILKDPTGQHSSTNSTRLFENPRDITIYGGIFNASTYNPVVHDPVVREVREQNHKILQAIHIQWVVLFS